MGSVEVVVEDIVRLCLLMNDWRVERWILAGVPGVRGVLGVVGVSGSLWGIGGVGGYGG